MVENRGTQRTVENGREQRVQCSTWSTESIGTLREHGGQWRTGENREYSVVHGVQRVLGEHRTVENGREQGNTEDSGERERTESTV